MNDSLACFQNFYTRARTHAHPVSSQSKYKALPCFTLWKTSLQCDCWKVLHRVEVSSRFLKRWPAPVKTLVFFWRTVSGNMPYLFKVKATTCFFFGVSLLFLLFKASLSCRKKRNMIKSGVSKSPQPSNRLTAGWEAHFPLLECALWLFGVCLDPGAPFAPFCHCW